jgi:hypothetical protein
MPLNEYQDTAVPEDTAAPEDAAAPTDGSVAPDTSLPPMEQQAPNATPAPESQPSGIDPLYVDATMQAESSGRADAISHNPKTGEPIAYGAMQFTPSTWKTYGEGDILNKEDSKRAGTKYLTKLDTQFSGDKRLASAGYNYGEDRVQKLMDKYGDSYDAIKDHLPSETQVYVDRVTNNYAALKKNSNEPNSPSEPASSLSAPVADLQSLPPTRQGFAKGLLQTIGTPDFDSKSTEEKAQQVLAVYRAKRWAPDATEVLKTTMSTLWEGAPKSEQPDFASIIGAPPVVPAGKDPTQVTADWKHAKTQELLRNHIPPAIFGTQLDTYLNDSAKSEVDAYAERNRGVLGTATMYAGNTVRELAKGAASGITEPLAGVSRLTGLDKAADVLQGLPEDVLGKSPNGYLYHTLPNGHIDFNSDGTPKTKITAQAAQVVGQVGAFIAGGAELKALGWGSKAIYAAMTSTNALMLANQSFKEIYDETGDRGKAYAGTMLTVPAALIGTTGELAVISKWASPAMRGLGTSSAAKYLGLILNKAELFARNAAVGGPAMLAMDATAQAGVMMETGKPFNTDRAESALIGGGLITGAIGAYRGPVDNAPKPPPQNDPDAIDTPGSPLLRLPAPETGAPKLGLPAPETRPALPGTGNKKQLSGPTFGPAAEAAIQVHEQTSAKDAVAVSHALEGFRASTASNLVLTHEQAVLIPPEFMTVFQLTPSETGTGIVLTKRTSYVPKEVEGLVPLEAEKASLVSKLSNLPSSDAAPELYAQRTALRSELAQASENVTGEISAAVRERSALQKTLDSLKAAHETEDNPILRKIGKEDLNAAEEAVTSFDATHEEAYNAWQKVGPIQDAIDAVTAKLKSSRAPLNDNDIKAMEADLVDKSAKITKLRQDAAAQAAAHGDLTAKIGVPAETKIDFSQGVRVGDKNIVHANNKWHVVADDGTILSKGHSFFHDALTAAKGVEDSAKLTENRNRQFVTKEPDRTALTPKDEEAITRQVAVEKKARDDLAAIQAETRIKGKEAYDKAYADKVAKAQQTLAKEQKRTENLRKKRTGVVRGLAADEAPAETTSLRASSDNATPVETSQAEIVAKKILAPTSLSKVRRRLSKAAKPLTSNYTKPIKFSETATEVVPASKIFSAAQKLVSSISKNTKIFTGGRVPENVLGFLNFVKDYVKVGRHGDISTLLHELTHVIDRSLVGHWDNTTGKGNYDNVPKDVVRAAQDMADTFYPAPLNSDNLRTAEGFAMFFQHYATGQPVRQELLNWYKGAFRSEFPDVFKQMENLKNLAFKYYDQTPLTYSKSGIVKAPNKFLTGAKDYFSFNSFRDKWLSSTSVFRDVDKAGVGDSIKDLSDKNQRRAAGIVDQFISRGPVDLRGTKVHGLSLEEAFSPAKGKYDILNSYLLAMRDVHQFKSGIEAGGNVEDTTKIIKEVQTNHPEVVQAANNYYRMLDQFDSTLRQASREWAYYIDKRRIDNKADTGKEHGYYVPKAREGFGGRFNAGKKVVGSTRDVIDPVSNIREALHQDMERALLSEVKEGLVDKASSPVASSIGLFVREVTGQERIGLARQLDDIAKGALGPDAAEIDKKMYSVSAEPIDGITNNKFKVFSYLDGSKGLRLFEVDPRITQSLTHDLPDVVNTFWFKYLYRPGAQLLRPMATSFRLAFQVKNLLRDPVSLWRYVKSSEGGFKDALSIFRGYATNMTDAALYTGGKDLQRWVALADRLGVLQSTSAGVGQDIRNQLSKQFGKNIFDLGSTTLDKLENILSTPETGGRVTSMQLALKELGVTNPNQVLTPAQASEAILAFKRGTTNFGDQGSTAKVINMGVPFFTARIAELTRIPTDFRRNPGKMLAYGAAALSYGLYHSLAHKDETWYNELQPDAKMNNVWHKVSINGVNKLLYIPLEYWGAVNYGLGQAIGALMNNDKLTPVGYYELARAYIAQNASPINSKIDLLGPWGKELVQQYANYDSYFRKDIVPPSLKYEDPKLQYNDYTSELAKRVGALTDTSPLLIDHAIRSTAPAASDALQFIDKSLGYKKAKEYDGLNFVTTALTKSGTAETIADRSQQAFSDKLLQFRENKPAESPEEGRVRKALEKVNTNVSELSTVMYGTDDAELKKQLGITRREQLQLGLRIASGATESVGRSGVKTEAKSLRTEKKKSQGEAVKQRRDITGEGLLKGSTESP